MVDYDFVLVHLKDGEWYWENCSRLLSGFHECQFFFSDDNFITPFYRRNLSEKRKAKRKEENKKTRPDTRLRYYSTHKKAAFLNGK